MKPNPLISIIIPVFNKEEFIDRCLHSILSQVIDNYEILLINDGSTDRSGKISESYEKEYHQIRVYHQENQGVSAARNTGINNASGKWIIFVDADDWIEPLGFEHLNSILKNYPIIDLISCFHNEVNQAGLVSLTKLPDQEVVYNRNDYLKHELLPGFPFSLIVSRQLLYNNNLRYNTLLGFQEDTEFNFKCVINSDKILVYNKAFYNYYVNEESTSLNLSFNKINDILLSYLSMHDYAKNDISTEVKQQLKLSLNNSLRMFMIEGASNYKRVNIQASKIRKSLFQFLQNREVEIQNIYPHILLLILLSLMHIRIVHVLKRMIAFIKTN